MSRTAAHSDADRPTREDRQRHVMTTPLKKESTGRRRIGNHDGSPLRSEKCVEELERNGGGIDAGF